MPKLCEFETCREQASYGEFYGKPIRCKDHKGDFKLVSKLCQEGNCNTCSSYNYEGETKQLYCSEHKKDGMINMKNKRCKYLNCKIIPNYNYHDEKIAIFCSSHKKDGMIDIKHKRCEYLNCKSIPAYNFEGEKNARFCSSHKEVGMVDIKNKRCQYLGCKIIPIYNYEEEIFAAFCSIHKKDGMVDIKNKKCEHPNCNITPSYNFYGEKKAVFCYSHKKDEMVNIKHKKCEYLNCNTIPSFNYKGETNARFCFIHKKDEMIDIVNKNKKCKANFCLGTRGNTKYKGYCAPCYQQLFPNDPLTLQIRSKTKEIAVRDFLNINFNGFINDKPLWSENCECTHRRRIDFRKLIGNTLLCIEVDEEQHKGYGKKEEEIRYDDLYMLHCGKFIFIRFNPDKFKNKDGKTLNPMLYTRLPLLKEEIEKQIKRIESEDNIELLEIFKLYYDEIKN
jgi:hypothetical protein